MLPVASSVTEFANGDADVCDTVDCAVATGEIAEKFSLQAWCVSLSTLSVWYGFFLI
jgi:hypothetical protein